MWSVSEHKAFRRCQRQWYFKNRFASPKATKVPEKREAYILGTLQTISAWRGQVVDSVVETVVVPALREHQPLYLRQVLAAARRIFDQQLAFAQKHQVRTPNMVKGRFGTTFAALLCVEEGQSIEETEILNAWEEVERAIRNLFAMKSLRAKLRSAQRLFAQSTLWHELNGQKIKAIPDLVAFFADEAPLIIDWKVHHAGMRDSRFQLETYALAISRSNGSAGAKAFAPTDIRLAEVQLLTNQVKHYRLTAERALQVENEILASISDIEIATDGRERDELNPLDLLPAWYPETCAGCGFKKLCWEPEHYDRN